MGKVPTRLRAVTYTLSPMRTGVMHGLFKDWAAGMAKRVQENAFDVGVFFALPVVGTVWCVDACLTRSRARRHGVGANARGGRGSIGAIARVSPARARVDDDG